MYESKLPGSGAQACVPFLSWPRTDCLDLRLSACPETSGQTLKPAIGPQFAETFERQIGAQKPSGLTKTGEQGFGSEIPAAHRSFHCGRPARPCPVARKKEIPYGSFLAGAPAVHARLGRKRRIHFLNHGCFQKPRFPRSGQHVGKVAHTEVDNLLSRSRNQIV